MCRWITSYAAKERPIPNQKAQPVPPGTAFAKELWRWAFLPQESRTQKTSISSELSIIIECYLGGAFHRIDFTRSRGIWCDGIIELLIERISRRAFLIFGVAYGPIDLAPFEIEIHFARRRDHEPLRTIIRFGEFDHVGELKWHTNAKKAGAIVANRPQHDRDWAVAIELTPANS